MVLLNNEKHMCTRRYIFFIRWFCMENIFQSKPVAVTPHFAKSKLSICSKCVYNSSIYNHSIEHTSILSL